MARVFSGQPDRYDGFGQLIELCDPLTTTELCDGFEDAAVPGAGERGPMEYAYDESDGDPLWVDNTAGERTTFVTVSAEGWPVTVIARILLAGVCEYDVLARRIRRRGPDAR
jgi:hypothetical protein